MIFICKHNDRIYFSLRQTSNLLKVLDELYQLSKKNNFFWYSSYDMKLNAKKVWCHKYLTFAVIFGFVRMKTDTFTVDFPTGQKIIRHYKYKIISVERVRQLRNIIIKCLKSKDKMLTLKCSTLEVVESWGDRNEL